MAVTTKAVLGQQSIHLTVWELAAFGDDMNSMHHLHIISSLCYCISSLYCLVVPILFISAFRPLFSKNLYAAFI